LATPVMLLTRYKAVQPRLDHAAPKPHAEMQKKAWLEAEVGHDMD
jgi:hypothetical protein